MIESDLVQTLEDLLARAKAGELEGLAAACLMRDQHVGVVAAGAAVWEAPSTTIGLLWQLQQEIHLHRHAPATP